MQIWADVQLGLARSRREELEAEAAAVRLASFGTRTGPNGLRGSVGRALIRAGRALAGEPMIAHGHGRRVAVRQP